MWRNELRLFEKRGPRLFGHKKEVTGGGDGWDMMTLMGQWVVHAKYWFGNLKGKGLSERPGRKWDDITRWMRVWGLSILPVRDYALLWSMLLKSVVFDLVKCRYKAVVPTGTCSWVNRNMEILHQNSFHENGSLFLLPHTHSTRRFSRQQNFSMMSHQWFHFSK